MTATEYLRKRNIVANNKSDLIIGFDDGSEVSLIEIMDSYHQAKLKLLGIANVVWRSEQFSCPLPDARCDRHKIDDEEGRWEFCNTCKREWAR